MAEKNISGVSVDVQYIHLPYFIIAFLGITSNVLLHIAFVKDPLKCFRNSATYLVMNLSVSDTFACLFFPFILCVFVNPRFNAIVDCLFFSVGSASLLSITSISIDRYLAVAHPLKYRNLVTRKVLVVWLSCTWLGGSIVPTAVLFFGHKVLDVFAVYCSDALFILVSSAVNSATYLNLKKHLKNIALLSLTESRAQEIRILKEKRFLKTIIIITCVTVVCIMPSVVYYQIHTFIDLWEDGVASESFGLILQVMFCTNFAVSPMIYVLRLPNYRRTFYLLYCKRGS